MLFPQKTIHGIEVGVHQGIHAVKMLNNHNGLYLHGIDMWDLHAEEKSSYLTSDGTLPAKFADKEQALAWYNEAKSRLDVFGPRCTLLKIASVEAATYVCGDACYDFVYIDADHSYEACMQDLYLWLPKVKKGGLLAGHDYGQFGVTDALNTVFGPKGYYHNNAGPKVGQCWIKVKD